MEKNNIWNIREQQKPNLWRLLAPFTTQTPKCHIWFPIVYYCVLTIMWPTAHRCIVDFSFYREVLNWTHVHHFRLSWNAFWWFLCKQSNHKISPLPLLLFGVEIAVNTNGRIDKKATVTTITQEIKTFHQQQHLRFSKTPVVYVRMTPSLHTVCHRDSMTSIQRHTRARLQKLLISYFQVTVGELCWYAEQYRLSFFLSFTVIVVVALG